MYKKGLVYIIAAIAATGGLLFGFDTGVISGAIPFFQNYFEVNDSAVEWVTTAGPIGAIIGAISCGKISDLFGRKKIILLAAVIFAAGALWSGAARSIEILVYARLFLGIAIGISSFSAPLYIAEISPAKSRGSLVGLFQLMITMGILLSYFSDLFYADEQNLSCWRPMFYAGLIPALVLLVGVFFLPESPRWLISRGQIEKGREVMSKIEPPEYVESVLSKIESELRSKSADVFRARDLFTSRLKTPLIIAVFIMFFQQFVGINTVIYYSPKIFLMAGFDGAVSAIWAAVGIGVVNVCFTILSVFFIDRIGRRRLYFLGLTGIALSLVSLSCCFAFAGSTGEAGKWLSVILMFIYVAFFAVSIGPLGWLIISEIFPQKLRGLGASIGSLSVWLFNGAVTFTFFKIVNLFSLPGTELSVAGESTSNPAGAFLFYGLIALAGLLWGYFFIPETKGVSLEQIEQHWLKGGNARQLRK
ncbi:MAG: sugar porter family MFS transporter [Prevotellaceae bacterium]|jgi:sugar porter (SP) family MFS transporter|nr:sugar porter family MFS transporter [Prevotellaceae bacterium]